MEANPRRSLITNRLSLHSCRLKMSELPEGTAKLVNHLSSYPAVNEARDAIKAASEKLAATHPWAQTFVTSAESLISALLSLVTSTLSSYGGYVDSYAQKAADALKSMDETYPTVQKPTKEVLQTICADIRSKIPEPVKATIRTSLLSMLKSLTEGLKQVKGSGEVGSLKELLNNTIESFDQLKVVVNHASSLASNVAENETAAKAAAASTDAILNQLGPEAKAKYEALPDAAAKAQFIAEEGWKKISTQIAEVNTKISDSLPGPLKHGYDATVKLVEKLSGDFSQQMPSNADMLKRVNEALEVVTKYLETLQQWLSEDSASM